MPVSKPSELSAIAFALCLSSVLPVSLIAQDQHHGATVFVAPEVTAARDPGRDVDIPQPPRVIGALPTIPGHGLPPIPVGTGGLPQPDDPEAVPVFAPQSGPGAPCDLRAFVNRAVKPSGALHSTVGEPSVAANNDTVFQTGNWYAARSLDSGMTWSHVNPFTRFLSVDGGFCCDQRALYVPQFDLTVWYLQYIYSNTTQKGSIRLATTSSRAELAADDWTSYVMSPVTFGLGNGLWFDFPDIAYGINHLYLTSNIFNALSVYQNSIVMRISLAQLDQAAGINITWWLRSGSPGNLGGGASYRFVQGATDTMYMASHNSTTSIRVLKNSALSTSWTSLDRTVSAWTSSGYSALAPNGSNWAGRVDGRINSGYKIGTEYGFLWTAAARTGRLLPYVRAVRLSVANDAVLANQDLHSGSFAWMYPATAGNASLDIGFTMAVGDGTGAGTLHPTNGFRIVDGTCHANFSGGSFPVFRTGTHSPSRNGWGDYFTVQRHAQYTDTFVATGMTQRGSSADSGLEPNFIWFGQEEDTPDTTLVTVDDNLLFANVPISVTHTDLDGSKDGTTAFSRRYTRHGRYELVAPPIVNSGSNRYVFCRWSIDINGGTNFVDQPDGQTTLSVDDIGGRDDNVRVSYSLETTITVDDRNVSGGVPITVSTTDLDGRKDGTTLFTRRYKAADLPFTFTAPPTAGSNAQPFYRWRLSGIPQPIGQRTISASPLTPAVTLEAEDRDRTQGAFRAYGAGCVGSNGNVPRHFSTSGADRGDLIRYEVEDAATNTSVALFFGFSDSVWNGTPLPLCLGFLGADPSCCLLAEGFLVLPFTTDGMGRGSKTIQTSSASPIGLALYTQTVQVDFGVPAPLKITVSNGLETTLGGTECN